MQNDKIIVISVAGSRMAKIWKPQRLMWSEFVSRVSQPVRSTETMAQYKAMKKAQQDDLKDVGGYVGGTMEGNRRKAGHVSGRCLVTLDADNIPPGGTQEVLKRVAALGCAYVVYSTRKHCAAAPRLRIVIPTDREAAAEEYEPAARKMAQLIGVELFDPTTFDPVRLMYWPSCCADGEWVFTYEDKPFLSVDGLLGMYQDWKDVSEWPEVPGMKKVLAQRAKRQQTPDEKTGIVGAFCKVYDIPGAIAKFLPEVYADCGNGRYTYTKGSTAAGAVLYDNGQFLYSNHATDPCSGLLVNAFDLVRIHKFGELDEEASEGARGNTLPSFQEMSRLALEDEAVKRERVKETFGGFAEEEDNLAWLEKLETDGKRVKCTARNIQIILENDPRLAGRFRYEEFSMRKTVTGELPWKKSGGKRDLTDTDMAGLRVFLETEYGIVGKGKIQDSFDSFLENGAEHEVKSYLNSLVWDGIPRLDGAFIEYLGADDSYYVRMSARKTFCAAVARIYVPGTKFDYMPTLIGPQGIGKSTFFRIMGKGWFTDSLRISDMKDKTGAEKLLGNWIVEASEMDGMNKTDNETVKAFLSQNDDVFRPAYGRETVRRPRQSVIVGTSNTGEFLKDTSGNRRFWPVDCGDREPSKNVFKDLQNEIDQMWAEAVARWRIGEPLYPDEQMAAEAKLQQEEHRQEDPRKGMIEEFLKTPIPDDWHSWDADRRRFYDPKTYTGITVERRSICAAEVWVECFKHPQAEIRQRDSREINAILRELLGSRPEWKADRIYPGADYGLQRGFAKSVTLSKSVT